MKNSFTRFIKYSAIVFMALGYGCSKELVETENTGDLTVSTSPIIFKPHLSYGSMTDQEGNIYKTVTIGSQTWMAENLRTTKYRDMTNISRVDDDEMWFYNSGGAYCNYKEDTIYPPVYGRLYNWYAVNNEHNIAPAGWHVPTDEDWQILVHYLDSKATFTGEWSVVSYLAGGKLKEASTAHWFPPNMGATNESGFTALPGGNRGGLSGFDFAGKSGSWWSSSYGIYGIIYYELSCNNQAVYRGQYSTTSAFSLRLVKD